ncbi:unnamed protein product [Arabidopsis thaliana]|uniref:Transmembrane protein n=1 Tax=Arabidopsis thaliana TaxID=3702 RepID=A0A5S9XQI0_ARATH|nr:unnamed protein product [Arabidopsis thaliana]
MEVVDGGRVSSGNDRRRRLGPMVRPRSFFLLFSGEAVEYLFLFSFFMAKLIKSCGSSSPVSNCGFE